MRPRAEPALQATPIPPMVLASSIPQEQARREAAAREMVKAAIGQVSAQTGLSRREVSILLGELAADRD